MCDEDDVFALRTLVVEELQELGRMSDGVGGSAQFAVMRKASLGEGVPFLWPFGGQSGRIWLVSAPHFTRLRQFDRRRGSHLPAWLPEKRTWLSDRRLFCQAKGIGIC